MKVVALVSGGKDSCYAMMQCLRYGHDVVALANLLPVDDSVDELDSYMYQTVGHQIVVSYAKCMGLPLFRRRLQGSTRHHALSYKMTAGDEVEDMFMLLSEVKRQIPSITAVCSGAIASDYQRLRVESVCSRLGLVSLAYLWKQDQSLLLEEMITSGIIAIIVKVAAIGLDPSKHLGRELAYMKPHLHHLNGLYGINVCGEGGEYESLTLDCPLFKFARIVLDDFQVVLHSSDSIAPVGVLHPVAFHLEPKQLTTSSGSDLINDISIEERVCVHEVEGDCTVIPTEQTQCFDSSSELSENIMHKVQMSKTDRGSTFSICCWLPEVCRSSNGLQADMKVVLTSVELHLRQLGFGWENVLYVHLYISNMNEFSVANETYVSFITQEKCQFGVPSRSTIELPLSEAGLGKTYIEVLVSRDQSKKVLHVQSISCWAPSCIGPYSQATLHHGVLHMAGQLGLDPPTMALTSGGPTAELEQALLNSEAVAKCFNCSISTSAIAIIIYCSQRLISLNRTEVQEKWESFLKQLKDKHLANDSNIAVLNPVVLFVFVPELPKRALVEVKPLLMAMADVELETCPDIQDQTFTAQETFWGFQPEPWHNSCIQKCILPGNICAVVINITGANIAAICREDGGIHLNPISESDTEKIAKFFIYLVNEILSENNFNWQDTMYLRFYYQTNAFGSMENLALIFSSAFREFAIINPKFSSRSEPIFNLVPVLGVGMSITSVESVLLTCELLAQKPPNQMELQPLFSC